MSATLLFDSCGLLDTAANIVNWKIPADYHYLKTHGARELFDHGGAFFERLTVSPSHSNTITDADGAVFELVGREDLSLTPEMLGGLDSDATFSNTPMLNKYNEFIRAKGQRRLVPRLNKAYYFGERPDTFVAGAPLFIDSGGGREGSTFVRNYVAGVDEPFITIYGVERATIRGLMLQPRLGTTGRPLAVISSPTSFCDGLLLEHINMPAGAGAWQATGMLLDGRERVSGGSIGLRDSWISNVAGTGAQIIGGQGIKWVGGEIGTLVVSGAGVTPSNKVIIELDSVNGTVNFDNANDCWLEAGSIAGLASIDDATCNNCEMWSRYAGGQAGGTLNGNTFHAL